MANHQIVEYTLGRFRRFQLKTKYLSSQRHIIGFKFKSSWRLRVSPRFSLGGAPQALGTSAFILWLHKSLYARTTIFPLLPAWLNDAVP
jgi:hypothetical protein